MKYPELEIGLELELQDRILSFQGNDFWRFFFQLLLRVVLAKLSFSCHCYLQDMVIGEIFLQLLLVSSPTHIFSFTQSISR